jgi:hypothetical protein
LSVQEHGKEVLQPGGHLALLPEEEDGGKVQEVINEGYEVDFTGE